MPYAKSCLAGGWGGGSGSDNINLRGGGVGRIGGVGRVGGLITSAQFLRLLNEKRGFLIMTFVNLIIQLGITYYIMMKYRVTASSGGRGRASSGGRVNKSETDTIMLSNVQYYLMIFAQFAIIFIIAAVPMPSVVKFILFSIFSSLFGIILSCIKSSFDNNVIETAIVGTMSIFGFMVMLGVALIMFGINLGNKIALFLLVALLLLIIARIVSLFMNTYSLMSRTFAMIGLVLFSLYIIYDTNHILQREYYGDFITASMDYYLDILNVFVNLLSGGN